jgi:hypothetical protein
MSPPTLRFSTPQKTPAADAWPALRKCNRMPVRTPQRDAADEPQPLDTTVRENHSHEIRTAAARQLG